MEECCLLFHLEKVKNWKKARKMFFEKMKEVIGSQVALCLV